VPDDDVQLLLRTHAGDERAARELWARHAAALSAYARSILRSDANAEDAVQTVFCALLTCQRSELRRITDARAWLVRSTRNASLNMLRTTRRDAARLRARPPTTPTSPNNDPDLARALDAIPRRLREIVLLRHAAGMTFDQIALATGLPRSTAAERYQAGLAALRARLNPHAPTFADCTEGATR
jgi:RNA polymerase sigma-70 factor, ECF subfamily